MNEAVIRAAEAAVRDHRSGTGSYYSGPETPVYLAVRSILNSREKEVTRE